MSQINKKPIAVLGAGYGGLALAGELALLDHDVRLFEFAQFSEAIAPIKQARGVEVTGQAESKRGFARLDFITDNMKQAVNGTGLIFLVAPAFAHDAFMKELLPCIVPGQIVIVCTSYWAGLRYGKSVRNAGAVLAENGIFVYASRRVGPTEVFIDGEKSELLVSAYPKEDTDRVFEALRAIFPQSKKAQSVLETAFNNINPVLHPVIAVLNIGYIEQKQTDFAFYKVGVSKKVGQVMDAIDAERLAVAKELGVDNVFSVSDWQQRLYQSEGEGGYQVIKTNKYYNEIVWDFPFVLRYIEEDVPFGLVPLSSLGHAIGVPTPTIDAIVELGCKINGNDYWKMGLNAEKLGIAGMSADNVRKLIQTF